MIHRICLSVILMVASAVTYSQTVKNQNDALSDLAHMFYEDADQPTFDHQFLDRHKLDFSVDSLKHVDEYLETVRKDPEVKKTWNQVILRAGAYAGEVIRQNDKTTKWQWIDYETAKTIEPKLFESFGKVVGTAAILYDGKQGFAFPLAKVEKYLNNGSGDSVYFFGCSDFFVGK